MSLAGIPRQKTVKDIQPRVGSVDPGGQLNAFAFVLTQVDLANKVIYVLGAHQWHFSDGQIDYPTVEANLAKIHSSHHLSYFACESNNTGLHVMQTMKKQYGIPTFGITTANRIKSKKIIAKGETMDKVEHVAWVNSMRLQKKILFPKQKTPGLMVLDAQLDSFVKDLPKGRKVVTYHAEEGDDDSVMAFLINTFFIRRKLFGDMGTTKHSVAFKKFGPSNDTIDLGSGVPEGSILLDRGEMVPISQGHGKWRVH